MAIANRSARLHRVAVKLSEQYGLGYREDERVSAVYDDRPTREPGFGAHTADRIGSKCGDTVTFIRLGRK